MKSKKKLFEFLEKIEGFKGVQSEGLNHPRIGNEVYGRRAEVYIKGIESEKELRDLKSKLLAQGFRAGTSILEYKDGEKVRVFYRLSVQVSYFKGNRHWE